MFVRKRLCFTYFNSIAQTMGHFQIITCEVFWASIRWYLHLIQFVNYFFEEFNKCIPKYWFNWWPQTSHYINNTDEEESIIGLPSEGQEDSWLDLGKPLLEEEVRRAIVEEIRRHVFKSELGRETLEDEGVAKKAEKVFVPPQTKSFSPIKNCLCDWQMIQRPKF